MIKLIKAKIVTKVDHNQELIRLWVKPEAPVEFKPGQYITLSWGKTKRAYSVASAPHEELIELFIARVPDKLKTEESLTPPLWEMKVGEELEMKPTAKGKFLLDPEFKTHVFVATTTGIAPFVSMIKAYAHRTFEKPEGYYKKKFENIYIFQGASYEDEFGYDQELLALDETYPEITYRNTVSQIPGLEKHPGRNKNWLADDQQHDIMRVNRNLLWYFGQYGIRPEDTVVYVCGNEKMIDDLSYGSTAIEQRRKKRPFGQLVNLGYEVRKEVYF